MERSTPPGAFAISIHALAKRATNDEIRVEFAQQISIHALAKRATSGQLILDRLKKISIHALAKRATLFFCGGNRRKVHFNPRPRKEGDSTAISFSS